MWNWKFEPYQQAPPTDFGGMAKYFTTMAPFILTSFLVLTSCFNQDVKGFVWLAVVGSGLVLVMLFQTLITRPMNPGVEKKCQPLWGFMGYDAPSSTSFFLMFTLAYFLAPMQINNDYNFAAIAVLLLLYMMDAVFNFMNRCADANSTYANVFSIVLGSAMGLIYGLASFYMLRSVNPNLVYYGGSPSNGEYCTKPKKQTFKCNVYKNGEIISTL
jgi:hypothetical protein